MVGFFTWLRNRRRDRHFVEFSEIYERLLAAQKTVRCELCGQPSSPSAKFCAQCAHELGVPVSKLHPLFHQERETAPLHRDLRPFFQAVELLKPARTAATQQLRDERWRHSSKFWKMVHGE